MAPETRSQLAVESDSKTPDDQWVSRHYAVIHRAAWYMTGDGWEAEDLAQETFVVAIDQWEGFDRRSSDATWLYGILIRLHQRRKRSFVRMRRRLAGYLDRVRDEPRETTDPKNQLAQEQWRESVWSDVARLPDDQKVAVILRYTEGLTYDEIAKSMGCATGTARTRVHHGLKRLRGFVDASEVPQDRRSDDFQLTDSAPIIHINARW